MSKRIWKYELEVTDEQSIEMPEGAVILSVQSQPAYVPPDISRRNQNLVHIWAEVEPHNPVELRHFCVFGTGHRMPDGEDLKFIGTVQVYNGVQVYHVYEKIS